MVRVGERLPRGQFKTRVEGAVIDINTEALFTGKKVVLFAVPGHSHLVAARIISRATLLPQTKFDNEALTRSSASLSMMHM